MTEQFYNYNSGDLVKEEPEYIVPLSSKLLKIFKYIIVAAVAVVLIIKVGVDNLNQLKTPKSQTNTAEPFESVTFSLT